MTAHRSILPNCRSARSCAPAWRAGPPGSRNPSRRDRPRRLRRRRPRDRPRGEGRTAGLVDRLLRRGRSRPREIPRRAGRLRHRNPMTDQLPAILQPGALVAPTDTYIVPALIADRRRPGQLALRRILHRQHQQRPHAPGLRPRLRPVLRLVRAARPHARGHPAVRRGGLGEGAAGETRGAGREAAARRGAHAVRLAGHRPGGADESGRGRARAEARGEDRQDAGARWRRVAQADRQHSDRDRARSARPRADRHPHLFLRAHQARR